MLGMLYRRSRNFIQAGFWGRVIDAKLKRKRGGPSEAGVAMVYDKQIPIA